MTHAGDVWDFTVSAAPPRYTVQVLDSAGTVLTEEGVAPRWVRVGGTAQCGGPEKATVQVSVA